MSTQVAVIRSLPWIGAVLFGAIVPAVLFAGYYREVRLLPIAFAVTFGHSLLLGLPVALLYAAMRWVRLTAAAAGGFLIGAMPIGLFAWPVSPDLRTTASVNGVTTIVDGVPTFAGWLQYAELVGIFGLLGAIGAIVCWTIIKWSGAFDVAKSNASPTRHQLLYGLSVAGVAVALSSAIAAIPSIMMDRSCHNLLRDGRNSATPRVNIDLNIGLEDWPNLTLFLREFSSARGMEFVDRSSSRPETVEVLALNACNEAGLAINAHRQIWKRRDPLPDRGVSVSVFDLSEAGSWRAVAKDLTEALESRWHDKVRFRDGGGRIVGKPRELQGP